MPPKVALDSNLFIDAFRSPNHEARLVHFHQRFAPASWMSAIVALELRAGVRSDVEARRLQRHILAPFERRGRVFAPGFAAWLEAGSAIARLARLEGLQLRELSRGMYNDVLLAASCREHGVLLITRNERDFARIRKATAFEFAAAREFGFAPGPLPPPTRPSWRSA